jgi:hypothetical protein
MPGAMANNLREKFRLLLKDRTPFARYNRGGTDPSPKLALHLD